VKLPNCSLLAAAVLAVTFTPLASARTQDEKKADAPGQPDGKAAALADKVMETLGGGQAWNNTHYLRFDFAVDRGGKTVARRSHTWDKWSGRYRLEFTKDDAPHLVLMNLNTKEGSAFVKGAKLEGEEQKKALEQAYGAWVNDTYWLLMPYKMRDPGVVLTYDGEERKDGEAWDKLRLTFDNVGLTPKDKYWAYVNRKTGLVDRWDFVLKGEDKAPTTFSWKNWKPYGKIQLADDRVNPADGTRIYFPVLEVPETLPEAVFTQP
jgi:hypothetical protein